MIINREISNPVKKTEEMKPEVFHKYIDICDQQKGQMTNAQLVEEIGAAFYGAHGGVTKDNLDNVWNAVKPKIMANPGLAQFILDFKAAESDYFFPWLISVWTSPSAALEMAYGAGTDLNGEWRTSIRRDDRINYFVNNVPTFVYNRERQLKVADLAMAVQHKVWLSRKSKVVDFGAGRMAWARYHGFRFHSTDQEIYAFDRDTSIIPEDLFAGCALKMLGLKYKHSDFMTEMENPDLKDADLVILGGVASYFPLEVFRERIVKPIYQLLRDGGNFFFDLQLDCPQYVWSVKLFDWPEIKLMKSPAEAIGAVEALRRNLWESGMKMSAEYALDTYNAEASSIMVTLTKL